VPTICAVNAAQGGNLTSFEKKKKQTYSTVDVKKTVKSHIEQSSNLIAIVELD
jgi:hypothetical protein